MNKRSLVIVVIEDDHHEMLLYRYSEDGVSDVIKYESNAHQRQLAALKTGYKKPLSKK